MLDDSSFKAYFGTKRLKQMGFKPVHPRELLVKA